jgi:hypothetical protein
MADKRIDELEEATTITATDLFVLEQANTAKKLSGQTMTTFLLQLAAGHGGISSITKTGSAGTNPVVDTYTITFADASTTTFNVTNGLKGDTGATGPTGPKGDDITILSASVQYQEWTSGTQYPTGTWLDNPPAVSQGSYLWTRTLINYSDGTTTTAYSVSRMGIDGSGAVSTVNGVSPDGSGNINLTAANVGALPDNYQAPVASVNGKTGSVNLVASDVSAVPVSGADGFLFRSSNTIGQKELMKSLWSNANGWDSGDITVNGLSDYRMFLIRLKDTHMMIFAALGIGSLNTDETYLRGVGGYASAGGYGTAFFSASRSGDTLTFVGAKVLANSGTVANHKVIEIIGVI